MVSLATSFGGIDLDCCVYNASGPRTGTTEMLAMVRSCVQVPRLRCVAALSSSSTHTHTFLQFFSICLFPLSFHHISLQIGESKAGAVLSKSATLVKQKGNDMPRYQTSTGPAPAPVGYNCGVHIHCSMHSTLLCFISSASLSSLSLLNPTSPRRLLDWRCVARRVFGGWTAFHAALVT